MAFTVEDGTGIEDANSYLSVAAFKAYHDDRGNDYSSYTDEQIEDALVAATDYVERTFGHRWKGLPEFTIQGLHWPAVHAYDRFGRLHLLVPEALQHAIAEYGWRALTAELAPDPTYDTSSRVVNRERKKVGPLEIETEYAEGGATAVVAIRSYPMADRLLRDLLTGGGTIRA